MRARRPRTQGACGSRFLVPGSRFGTPALPACAGLRVCGRDACAPRMHVVLGSWFLVLGSGRPRSQHAQDCAYAGETPAHPGCTWFSVLGSWFSVRDARTPGTRRIARMRAGRPRTRHRAGIACMRAGRPRTQDARGSRFLVPGSRFGTPALLVRAGLRACGRDTRAPRGHVVLGSWFLVLGSRFETPAHPGCTWFSVIAGMIRD